MTDIAEWFEPSPWGAGQLADTRNILLSALLWANIRERRNLTVASKSHGARRVAIYIFTVSTARVSFIFRAKGTQRQKA